MKKVDPRQSLPKLEEEVLKYWEDNNIFEKSVERESPKGDYEFYDGPPFATGTPHYGHIVASVLKDAVPRYWTMCGYRVKRRWGWDCHGLPIENIAEKELGIKHKKDIETMGVAKFNEFCRSKVLEYAGIWEKFIPRIGRWVDMKHPYRTMDRDFMESVWWVFKRLWDKGLIYEGYRVMHICPRCETTLSQQEVSENYATIKDISATVKFELTDEQGTFVLAWTTTPWTLPGNVALAIGKDINYVEVKFNEQFFILAKSRLEDVFKDKSFEIVEEFKGEKLVGKSYKPLFDAYSKNEQLKNRENGWKIYHGDFVTTEDGTGVVHIAPAFGEDDMNLGRQYDLPFVQHVGMDGVIKPEVEGLAGLNVKPKDDHQATDVEVIKLLAHRGLLFAKEKFEHSYPLCWRCDTPLLNYATSSWFVTVTDVKLRALETAKEINWSPEHMKEGRFGNWLAGARDWSISRQRFWATPMPMWKCEGNSRIKNQESGIKLENADVNSGCGTVRVFGSAAELEEASGKKVNDLHKHIVDEVTVSCECGGEMKRIGDVLDTWFDSGSMPYAQKHYPFENKEEFERSFPAQFIAEGVDQTRAWFYYLHVIGTALFNKPAYRNVIVNGIVQAEDGKKMSKKLKNYPDPTTVVEKYGADTLRLYLLSSPVVAAESINFSEKELGELSRGVFRMLWNSYSFFTMYAEIDKWSPSSASSPQTRGGVPLSVGRRGDEKNILDRWILSELQVLAKEVNEYMERYDILRATRAFAPFIDDLSNWYIRRSRKRFWKNENDDDKNAAYQTLYDVLVTLAKLMAPFTPFLAEEMYRNLISSEEGRKFPESVHLAEYPTADAKLIDEELNGQMGRLRNLVTAGLSLRATQKRNVRQPLATVYLKEDLSDELKEIMKEELNVKTVEVDGTRVTDIDFDWEITEDLRLEGQARELIRFIQEARKEAGYDVDNRIEIGYEGGESVFERFSDMIARETLATKISKGCLLTFDIEKEIKDEKTVKFTKLWLVRK